VATAVTEPAADAQQAGGADALHALTAQVLQLQKDLADLREEMQVASGLIKDLADQNSALVQRIELNRRRLRRLTVAGALLGGGLATTLGYVLLVK
jgi:predicted  nucleic acid-binding Zn-ribbon protein